MTGAAAPSAQRIDAAALAHFAEHGALRVPGLLDPALVGSVYDLAADVLRAEGVLADDTWSGPLADAALQSRLNKILKGRMKHARALAALLTPELLTCVDALVEGRETHGFGDPPLPQLLFSAPDAETWAVPHGMWHLDHPRGAEPGSPGVQAFLFLAPTPPGGGGTLVLEGSHRLLNDVGFLPSREVKRGLAREPALKPLFDARLQERSALRDAVFEVDGVVLRVRELVGDPGDVWFTDLRVLHTLAPNASAAPRLMATERFMIGTRGEGAAPT